MEVKIGYYRHYKGNYYQVIAISRHSETLEELIVYKALYNSKDFGDKAVWVRPKAMFIEEVDLNGQILPRFQYIGKSLKNIK